MGSKRSVRRAARTNKIEALEDREMFSATALSGLVGNLEQHFFAAPPVEQQVTHNADFLYDTNLGRQLEALVGNVKQTLASAHQLTGVSQARADYGFYGHGQTVAVIDSGIAWDHPSLGGGFGADYRIVGGWDFTEENDANPYDDGPAGAHGTHVAGIIGATANLWGDVGVAPGVDLVGLRVFNDQGAGYFSWVEKALRWVHENRNSFANPITAVNLSLGTAWNAATVPNWAMLEDEFAQLKADGIFIAVAAGNSFSTYNASGLSYPAASSYVVPVMSVDDIGSLSSFSQRHTRAIAAPGRSIRSTVPDYVGNQNRVADDWANFSGTSMASPYVAGASVLIREAMEFVGYTNITQDTIYNHMLSTADQFFDSATNQYYNRLNVTAALDALIPDDEFGSTAAAACNLGTITVAGAEISGLIGKRDDVDYFQFTAAATGKVAFTAVTTHGLEAVWNGNGVVSSDGNTFTLDVVAGQVYQVGLGSSAGIGYFDLTVKAESGPSFVDWGILRSEVKHDLVVNGQTWFRVSASQAGYVTAKMLPSTSSSNVSLAWYDANMQPLASRLTANGSSRVDSWAETGDALYLCVTGDSSDIDIQIANQVAVDGAVVRIQGTTAADHFAFSVGSTHISVSVNGITYDFDRSAVSRIEFDGDAGPDMITMTGTSGNETAVMRPHDVTFSGSGFTAQAIGIEDVTLNGLAGNDTATLYDSPGNDSLTCYPALVELKGEVYRNVAGSFECVVAYSVVGGYDSATFYDSVGDDIFSARPDRALLLGNGYLNVAVNFEQAVAHSVAGGYDRSEFYDSIGNDTLTAYPERTGLKGTGFWNVAAGFDFVMVYAIAGGDDRAVLYDSPGNDALTAYPGRVGLKGSGYWNVMAGFDCVVAYSNAGGYDTAMFYDSAGDDVYSARPDRALMQGSGYLNVAVNFEQTVAQSISGGYDRVEFYDSAGNDVLISRGNRMSLRGNGYFNTATGFRQAKAFAIFGGFDRAEFNDSPQDEYILAAVWGASVSGTTFYNEIRGFDEVLARKFNNKVRVEIDSTDFVFSVVGQNG